VRARGNLFHKIKLCPFAVAEQLRQCLAIRRQPLMIKLEEELVVIPVLKITDLEAGR
jgi:hypothetical protein